MSQKALIMPFKTKNSKYIYDGVTSEVIPSTEMIEYIISNYYELKKEDLFERYSSIEKKEIERTYDYIENLICAGMFYKRTENSLQKNSIKEKIYYGNGSQLIFVLTEQCNMRCEYCVYSDKYPKEISYSNAEMDFNTAKKAADEYIKIHQMKVERGYRKPLFVCFYGGEPLLKYELIKKIVDYLNSRVNDVKYYMTTNGLLLTEDRIDFLIKNHFNLTFSLDGFQENHDRNRVLNGGIPTFSRIIDNVRNLQVKKRKCNNNDLISFNCCYDNFTDIYKCIKFFESNYDIFNPFYCTFAPVKPYDSTYYDWVKKYVSENNYPASESQFRESFDKVRREFFSEDCTARFREIATSLFVGYYTFSIRNKWVQGEFNNSCVPGDKLAVYPNGNYTICEKMNGRFPIGNVNGGIDYEELQRVADLLSDNFVKKRCSSCPIKNSCSACFMFMDEDGVFNDEFCNEQKRSFQKRLESIYSYHEDGIDFLKLVRMNKEQMELIETNN